MLIDASLGRACCCCGKLPAECTPTPAETADALNVRMNTAQSGIANGSVLPIAGSSRVIGTAISYDAANHAVVINEAGVYAFNWQVLVQSVDAAGPVVISLQSLDGTTVLATSGALAVPTDGGTEVSGSTVAQLPAGSSWVLVNNSGVPISIAVAGTAPAAFAASLNVFKLT